MLLFYETQICLSYNNIHSVYSHAIPFFLQINTPPSGAEIFTPLSTGNLCDEDGLFSMHVILLFCLIIQRDRGMRLE